jgi:lipoprotein-anchoring transpeptidase ErfK/SrfK
MSGLKERKTMRKAGIASLVLAGALILGAQTAQAELRQFWDQGQQKFVTYDVKGMKQRVATGARVGVSGAARSYTPILRQTVKYDGPYGPNTIVINTEERRLYYIFADGRAYKYGIGVGREGFQWSGKDRISRKAEWPGWTPPPQMIKREAAKGRKLPAYMPGGINNPLGARALYIGSRLYRIHGSNEPWTIGGAVSSGCIRMVNDDVIDLYDKVDVGTRVIVL